MKEAVLFWGCFDEKGMKTDCLFRGMGQSLVVAPAFATAVLVVGENTNNGIDGIG